MGRKVDFGFCAFLALCGLGHLFGTLKFYEFGSAIFAWSMSGALAAFLLAFLNLVRLWYPSDRRVSFAAAVGSAAWVVVILLFGKSLETSADPRILMHGFAAVGLFAFSLKTFILASRID